ncbi:MAG: hypothetical protein VZS44_08195 [Bacilli bacterium]|nr:hypothetical protein [Bacilli bacterium]
MKMNKKLVFCFIMILLLLGCIIFSPTSTIYAEDGEKCDIPETYDGAKVGTYATREFDGDTIAKNYPKWTNGTFPQALVYQEWVNEGKVYDENGFMRIGEDGPYIVAICAIAKGTEDQYDEVHYGPKYDQAAYVGDNITFFFDNGGYINVVVGDAKDSHDSGFTPWGHYAGGNQGKNGDINVLEFWANEDAGASPYAQLRKDKNVGDDMERVVAWQNHGEERQSVVSTKKGIIERIIQHDVVSVVLLYELNGGYIIELTDDDKANFEEKNTEVYKGYIESLKGNADTSEKYCLFELFGSDIHWYRYLGEATADSTVGDYIYSGYVEDKVDEIELIDDILLYESSNYISCRVYKDRQVPLTNDDIKNGYSDPRVTIMTTSIFSGFGYQFGSMCMGLAKFFSSLVSYLLGPQLLDKLNEVITELETSEFWDSFKVVVDLFIGMAMIAFIISLVTKSKNYAIGKSSMKEAIERFIIGMLAFGMILVSVNNPTKMNDTIMSIITCVDSFFTDTIEAELTKQDDVIDISEDAEKDLQMTALIWKTCIFQPWCRGQFGKKYEKLYTQYAGVEKKYKMSQSHESSSEDGEAFFDSAKYTGDVKVPIGGGNYVQNWAAYLYSCGSQYHIDYDTAEEVITGVTNGESTIQENPQWPVAKTTAYNSSLMADTFRVIDAQMNIAPQEYEDGLVVNNYTKAHKVKYKYASEGVKMLFNASMLIFFIPLIFLKFKSFLLLIITAVQIIYHSILELFKENSGFKEYGKIFVESLSNYFLASLKIHLMLILYVTFIDNGLFKTILYCILCVVILSYKLSDIRRFRNNVQGKIRQISAHRN